MDFSGRDVGGYVEEAKKRVASLKIPEGYRLEWSGEYEYLVKTHRASENGNPSHAPHHLCPPLPQHTFGDKDYHSASLRCLFPLSVPSGFFIFLNYNMSIAVWVGIIALAGLDAETGVVMLLYLDLAHDQWKKEGKLTSVAGLKDAIMHGAVKRIRPKIMTVSVILAGLVPIMFSHGAGADVMKRIAAPMVGGVSHFDNS